MDDDITGMYELLDAIEGVIIIPILSKADSLGIPKSPAT